MTKITEVVGIGAAYAGKLAQAGINTLEQLLEAGASSNGRKSLADQTGMSGKLILKWVNLADLFRIKGIGEEFTDLPKVAGVDTVPELAQRNSSNLHKRLVKIYEEKNLVRRMPGENQVQDWIDQAKELPWVFTN